MRYVILLGVVLAIASAADAQWYTRPYADRYYKDDWTAQFLQNAGTWRKTIAAKDGVRVAYVQAWASEPYTLSINGQLVGRDADQGTVEHFEITKFIKAGDNQFVFAVPGGFEPDAILEGEIVYNDGSTTPIATDASWGAGGGARTSKTRRPGHGPSECHSAIMLDYTPRLRCENLMATTRGIIQRINLRGLLELRAARIAESLLSGLPLDDPTLLAEFRTTRNEVLKAMDGDALALMKAGKYEQAEPMLTDLHKRMAGVEDAITCARLKEACVSWQLQNSRLQRALNLPQVLMPAIVPPTETVQGLTAYQEWFRAGADAFAADQKTYLSDPSWSRHNKYGWLISPTLSGSDVGEWEFSIVPPESGVIDLGGKWHFTTDPKNEGPAAGFAKADFDDAKWQRIKAGLIWEFQGVGQENSYAPFDAPFRGFGDGGPNKPYNGYAWYRTRVLVPDSWKDASATLQLGDVAHCCWIYVNGEPAGEYTPQTPKIPQSPNTPPGPANIRLEIPPKLLKFGQLNTIAIRVYNADVGGGITRGPVLLTSNRNGMITELETRVGACLYRGWSKDDSGEQPQTAMLASALSPGAYVMQRGDLVLSNWELRGVNAPIHVALKTGNKIFVGVAPKFGNVYEADRDGPMSASWVLLWQGNGKDPQAKPLLVLAPRALSKITISRWFGQVSDVRFSVGDDNVIRPFGLVRLPGSPADWPSQPGAAQLATIEQWASMMRAYPVEFTELYKPSPQGADVTLVYGYADVKDAFNTRAKQIAPIPMLHALGIASNNPGLSKPDSAKALVPAAPDGIKQSLQPFGPEEWGGYWAVLDSDRVQLHVPPHVEKLYRGASTTFMNPIESFGWLRVFKLGQSWGANSVRCSVGFTIDWDLPFAKTLAGPYVEDEKLWKRLDAIVDAGRQSNQLIIINHFWGSFRNFPADEYTKAIGPLPPGYNSRTVRMPDNSSRYWKMNPDSRKLLVDIWRRIADRYKNLPADAVAYDLQNEPAYVYADDFNSYAADATAAIRSVDKIHTIIVEPGNGWADPLTFRQMKATGDANTWYSYHRYHEHSRLQSDDWLYYPSYQTYLGRQDPARMEEVLLDTIRFGIVNNSGIHCGETGMSILLPAGSADRWAQDFYEFCEKYDVHWSWWEFTSNGYWRTGLTAGMGKEPGSEQLSPVIPIISRFMNMNDRNGFHPEWYPHEAPAMKALP